MDSDFIIKVADHMPQSIPQSLPRPTPKKLKDVDGGEIPIITVTVGLWEW